jgi:hypothetical protein
MYQPRLFLRWFAFKPAFSICQVADRFDCGAFKVNPGQFVTQFMAEIWYKAPVKSCSGHGRGINRFSAYFQFGSVLRKSRRKVMGPVTKSARRALQWIQKKI